MDKAIHEEKVFEKIDYSGEAVANEEFIDCEFKNCLFINSNLGNSSFMDCIFDNCNFSVTGLDNTALKNIQFKNCKIMGIDFSRCNNFLFSVAFDNCLLDYSVFFQKKLKKIIFQNCSLKEVDFTEADLSMSLFSHCDLLNATFVNTILEKADFRSAINYSFDPEQNKIKKAKFSHVGITGLLVKYGIDIE